MDNLLSSSFLSFLLSPLPIGDALLMANVLAGDAAYGPPFHRLHSIPSSLYGTVQ
jgi:hypothetical protein